MAPSADVSAGVPQLSVAVAVPSAASVAAELGLQPRVKVVPDVIIAGTVTSYVQLTVLDAVEVLPQPSVAVQVLVWEREQPALMTAASVVVNVADPQLSVVVAEPKALLIATGEGLHPNVVVVPVALIVGDV